MHYYCVDFEVLNEIHSISMFQKVKSQFNGIDFIFPIDAQPAGQKSAHIWDPIEKQNWICTRIKFVLFLRFVSIVCALYVWFVQPKVGCCRISTSFFRWFRKISCTAGNIIVQGGVVILSQTLIWSGLSVLADKWNDNKKEFTILRWWDDCFPEGLCRGVMRSKCLHPFIFPMNNNNNGISNIIKTNNNNNVNNNQKQ